MGSGSSRKLSDSPIIRTPKQEKTSGKGGSGSGGSSQPNKIADICIQSFEISLTSDSILKDGKVVTLQKENSGLYNVMFLIKKIGELNKKISEMIDVCDEMGVSYQGKIVKMKKTGKFYARFIRK